MNGKGENHANGDVAIVFDNVRKSFSGRKIIDDVSFSVNSGETLCILGRSGTGKSVTLKLMIGLMKADEGKVMIQNEDMGTLDETGLAKVRRRMGYLFQGAALFDSFSVGENLALPLRRLAKNKSPEEINHSIEEVLTQVGLQQDLEKLPGALSGGMLKRAGLARALVLKPQILLVDEPSSGLDRITASEIDNLLIKVKKECHTTIVIVTHDVRGARKIADKLAVLDRGRLLAFGTPEELDRQHDEHVQQFISEECP